MSTALAKLMTPVAPTDPALDREIEITMLRAMIRDNNREMRRELAAWEPEERGDGPH